MEKMIPICCLDNCSKAFWAVSMLKEAASLSVLFVDGCSTFSFSSLATAIFRRRLISSSETRFRLSIIWNICEKITRKLWNQLYKLRELIKSQKKKQKNRQANRVFSVCVEDNNSTEWETTTFKHKQMFVLYWFHSRIRSGNSVRGVGFPECQANNRYAVWILRNMFQHESLFSIHSSYSLCYYISIECDYR